MDVISFAVDYKKYGHNKNQKSHFPKLFECKIKKGYEIWCTYYVRCYGKIRTVYKIIYLY